MSQAVNPFTGPETFLTAMMNVAAATGSRVMGSLFCETVPKDILGRPKTPVNLVSWKNVVKEVNTGVVTRARGVGEEWGRWRPPQDKKVEVHLQPEFEAGSGILCVYPEERARRHITEIQGGWAWRIFHSREQHVSRENRIGNQGGTGKGMIGVRLCRKSLMFGLLVWVVAGCAPPGIEGVVLGDIRPPIVKNAQLENAREFVLEFDEPIQVREGSFCAEPGDLVVSAESTEAKVNICFEPQPAPGEAVTLAGNVQDLSGNTTRVQVQFKGYNDRPAALVLCEVQTAKNTSKKTPHRDYAEFYVRGAGNLGGMFVQWASSAKTMRYDFPACEVREGEAIVLHLAPEGISDEKNESGNDLGLSGGIDATSGGRDFWSDAGGLPDASGAISVYEREGDAPVDGLFYAESSKSGALGASKLVTLAQELADAGLWHLDSPPTWKNALLWKPSAARPLLRASISAYGAEAWTVGESSSQSPGFVAR